MILEFCKDLTPYFQNASKAIVLVVTNQVHGPDPETTHLPIQSYHPLRHRHTGLWTP
jgi:hypothetical protein